MMYDVRCDELARIFLGDEAPEVQTEANVARIAQAIQHAIEDELADLHEEARPARALIDILDEAWKERED